MGVSIQAVKAADIPEVLSFALQARDELFPTLSATGTPHDLAQFEAVYLQYAPTSVGASSLAKNVNDNACFLDERGACGFFASKLAPTKEPG